jgi:hypothetical protein
MPRAAIGLSMTGSDEATLRKALKKTVDAVEERHLAQVLVSEIEMIRMPLSPDWKEEAGLPEGMGDELPWEKN